MKPLLYTYRVLLTGLRLLRTGTLEANLVNLQTDFPLSFLPDLIACKVAGPEQATIGDGETAFHEKEIVGLRGKLGMARETSTLPEAPGERAHAGLHDLLLRARRKFADG